MYMYGEHSFHDDVMTVVQEITQEFHRNITCNEEIALTLKSILE
jgi:hypothetical protein